LYIKESGKLNNHIVYQCSDVIDHIEWSPDSKFILCQQSKRAVVEVWSIEEHDWRCKIDEGLAGLS